ncbi:hypothetical protein WICPIJ_001942 [Wickerhamomyces pijperi]|uniref:Uncharacterized protein n=1 Tax=Wickerhamomyces pijperi TaxID=599730 RepID=A0A9P8QCT3_WICPI|nr:hypothetical protein WICPIJ_001942 [Wickerhamomyces pijperi]
MLSIKRAKQQLDGLVQPAVLGKEFPVLLSDNIEQSLVDIFLQTFIQYSHQSSTDLGVVQSGTNKEWLLQSDSHLGMSHRLLFKDIHDDLVELLSQRQLTSQFEN